MEKIELKKRLADLRSVCERFGRVTSGSFLTPAELYENASCGAVFYGGYEDAERKIAVFLPEWMDAQDFDVSSCMSCLEVQSYFGVPTHRDYLGAILGLGISRDRIGDILVSGDRAYVICMRSVGTAIVSDLDKVGRVSVRVREIPFAELPAPERKTKTISFTVKSPRLDAVASDIFGISRTDAAQAIKQGLVTLNYYVTLKSDASVKENDIISLRGKGKAVVSEIGGRSRRDRIFITAEIYV